jgi:hypothetical protein
MLGHAQQLIGYPVDNVAYATFEPHEGTMNSSEFLNYLVGASNSHPPSKRGMSISVFILESTAEQQDYSCTVRASYYTRWPLSSVPGQSMRDMPTAPTSTINAARDHAENTANNLHPIGNSSNAPRGSRSNGNIILTA